MSRNHKRQRKQHAHQRQPQPQPMQSRPLLFDEEARADAFDLSLVSLAEKQMQALHTRMDEDPQARITTIELNLIKLGQQTIQRRRKEAKAVQEERQAEAQRTAEAKAEETETSSKAAALGNALMQGDARSAMQLLGGDNGNEWPEGVDGLTILAMAAAAEGDTANGVSESPADLSARVLGEHGFAQ